MPRITATGGVAAAALVVALGAAAPAAAWVPPLHGGESPSAAPSVAADHADHRTGTDHDDHGAESAVPEDHSRHGSPAEEGTGHDGGHGGDPDSVSDQTRVTVLGGFGAVNAAVVGSAFLLRRRDRRTGTRPRTSRGSHR